MIAMNPSNSETSGPTIQKVGSGIVIIGCSDLDICDYERINSEMRTAVVKFKVAICEYKDDVEHVIESIEEATFALKKFGAVIHRSYSRYFIRYVWTVKFWPPRTYKNFSHQTQANVALQQHYSGAHPQNHGRHFNRRVYWRRK